MVAAFMLWFSERTWVHHYVSFILTLTAAGAVLSDPARSFASRGPRRAVLIVFAAVSFLASDVSKVFGPDGVDWAKAFGVYLWPSVVVAVVLLRAVRTSRDVRSAETFELTDLEAAPRMNAADRFAAGMPEHSTRKLTQNRDSLALLMALYPASRARQTTVLRIGRLVDATVQIHGAGGRRCRRTADRDGWRCEDRRSLRRARHRSRPLLGHPGPDRSAYAHHLCLGPHARNAAQQSAGAATAVTVFLAQDNARKTLEAGVTTVRDLGAQDYADIAMRTLINSGAMVGPRMFVAGYGLTITRGTPRPGAAAGGRADGLDDVMRVARAQIGAGADWVKMFGSTGSFQDVSGFQTFTYDEMKAAVTVAHQLGKPIAIHLYGPSGARDAVRAGVDSLEHAVDIDDETLALMVKQGTVYVPTVDHNRYYADNAADYGWSSAQVDALRAFVRAQPRDTEARGQSRREDRHGLGCRLFRFRPEHPRSGLVREGRHDAGAGAGAATTTAAALLRQDKNLGAWRRAITPISSPSKAIPSSDINVVINDVRWVMKEGAVVVDKTKGASAGAAPPRKPS